MDRIRPLPIVSRDETDVGETRPEEAWQDCGGSGRAVTRPAVRVLRGRDAHPWRVDVFPVGEWAVFVVEGHVRDEDGHSRMGWRIKL